MVITLDSSLTTSEVNRWEITGLPCATGWPADCWATVKLYEKKKDIDKKQLLAKIIMGQNV